MLDADKMNQQALHLTNQNNGEFDELSKRNETVDLKFMNQNLKGSAMDKRNANVIKSKLTEKDQDLEVNFDKMNQMTVDQLDEKGNYKNTSGFSGLTSKFQNE